MASTKPKTGGWLANYYLRGVIALAVALIALALGADSGLPLLIGAAVWVALWLAAHFREGYAGTDRQP